MGSKGVDSGWERALASGDEARPSRCCWAGNNRHADIFPFPAGLPLRYFPATTQDEDVRATVLPRRSAASASSQLPHAARIR